MQVSTEAAVGQETWERHDCVRIEQKTPHFLSQMQAEVHMVDSGLHIVQTMEGSCVSDVVTEVRSVNPGVCMGAGKGVMLLGKGCERGEMGFVGAHMAVTLRS